MHVTAHSKEVKKDSIFFALKGAKFDGHDFIPDALKLGAKTIYSERDVGIPGVIVLGTQARKKLGELASEMMGNPSHDLIMLGVTGTSGKTTTTYLIHHLLESLGLPCARLGTNGGYFKNQEIETSNTTPDALTLQKWFSEVKNLGAKAVVMEVSSHALHQDRTWGIAWDRACFLNLSREHMDYHATLDEYYEAKALLFKSHADYSKKLGKDTVLFSNGDSIYGKKLLAEVPAVQSFSEKNQIRNIKNTPDGISAEVFLNHQWIPFQCPLFGLFQIENILAAISVVVSLGLDPHAICNALATFSGVPGRMESIQNQKGISVFVDYAHKPEALEKVLNAIQGRKIITVFGCGGDRDKTKRPVMGEIATRLSHFVYLTSDNPRTENPIKILEEIQSGIKKNNFKVLPDRAEAIRAAIQSASPGEIVLIAGKGHEDYQIFGTQKIHFDDREEARKALGILSQ